MKSEKRFRLDGDDLSSLVGEVKKDDAYFETYFADSGDCCDDPICEGHFHFAAAAAKSRKSLPPNCLQNCYCCCYCCYAGVVQSSTVPCGPEKREEKEKKKKMIMKAKSSNVNGK